MFMKNFFPKKPSDGHRVWEQNAGAPVLFALARATPAQTYAFADLDA